MRLLDWLVVVVYLAGSMWVGLWLSRRGSASVAEFLLGGRAVPWWLAGMSMAGTTFNADTPLYVAGLVARRGIAGNWEWWCFAATHVVMAVVLARMWRRAEVMTDAELIELRYGGRAAALLRATRAFAFGIPLNCIAIAYGMLAMRKIIVALGIAEIVPLPGDPQLWAVVLIVVITLIYTAASGLWGVLATDFFQTVLGFVGAIIVMGYALGEVGGLGAMREALIAGGHEAKLRLVPRPGDALPMGTFAAYLLLQWWTYRLADGGGMFVQRLSSVKDEREAERASLFFNFLNYPVRTWPWVIVALAALVVLPPQSDPEMAYPLMMVRYLPVGVLGLVFASLLAAFMSTVATQVNWGASYAVRDLYQRFVSTEATQEQLVRVARIATVFITLAAAALSFYMADVGRVFRFLVLFGNGTGVVLLLRWFWWRVNAWAEWTALVAGMAIAIALSAVPSLAALSFGLKIAITTFGTMACWLPVMLLTPPEAPARLDSFYRRARPPGPGWRVVRARTGVEPPTTLPRELRAAASTLLLVMGPTLAIGGLVVGSVAWGVSGGAAAVAGWVLRKKA